MGAIESSARWTVCGCSHGGDPARRDWAMGMHGPLGLKSSVNYSETTSASCIFNPDKLLIRPVKPRPLISLQRVWRSVDRRVSKPAIELRNHHLGVSTLSCQGEDNMRRSVKREPRFDALESETRCVDRSHLRGNRDASLVPCGDQSPMGRSTERIRRLKRVWRMCYASAGRFRVKAYHHSLSGDVSCLVDFCLR